MLLSTGLIIASPLWVCKPPISPIIVNTISSVWECELTPLSWSSPLPSGSHLSPPFLLQVGVTLILHHTIRIIHNITTIIVSITAFFSVSGPLWPSPSPDFFLFSRWGNTKLKFLKLCQTFVQWIICCLSTWTVSSSVTKVHRQVC